MAAKTGREARIERLTWYALVLVIVVMSFDRNLLLPAFVMPLVLGLILATSGIYQRLQKYPISLMSWGIAVGFFIAVAYDLYFPDSSPVDLRLISIIGVVLVIGWGAVTNEG